MAQNVLILDDTMTAIADAIREMNGTQGKMLPRDMPDAIKAGGGGNDLKALVEGTLTELKIPDGTTAVTSHFLDGYNADHGPQRVVLANSVRTIGEYAFTECGPIEVLICGTGLQTIETYALSECSNLVHTYIRRGIQDINTTAFNNSGSGYSGPLRLFEENKNELTHTVVGTNITRRSFFECSFSKNSNDWIVTKDAEAQIELRNNTDVKDLKSEGPGVVAYVGMDAEVTVPDTEGTILHSYCLAGRQCLTDVTISAGITAIQVRVIYNSNNIKTVRLLGTPNEICSYAFEPKSGAALKDIYVPWSEGDIDGAPWGAPDTVQIHYNS